jgi:hypothetical protein
VLARARALRGFGKPALLPLGKWRPPCRRGNSFLCWMDRGPVPVFCYIFSARSAGLAFPSAFFLTGEHPCC